MTANIAGSKATPPTATVEFELRCASSYDAGRFPNDASTNDAKSTTEATPDAAGTSSANAPPPDSESSSSCDHTGGKAPPASFPLLAIGLLFVLRRRAVRQASSDIR